MSLLEEDLDEHDAAIHEVLEELKRFREDIDTKQTKALWWGIGILGTLVVSLILLAVSTVDQVVK